MEFKFKTKKLKDLYEKEKDLHKFPPIVDQFFDVMAIIDAAVNEHDLYALKGLRYEKLKGNRKYQHSLRLNIKYRLIVEPKQDEQGDYLLIVNIEDYH